jgi:hypothetical protein
VSSAGIKAYMAFGQSQVRLRDLIRAISAWFRLRGVPEARCLFLRYWYGTYCLMPMAYCRVLVLLILALPEGPLGPLSEARCL